MEGKIPGLQKDNLNKQTTIGFNYFIHTMLNIALYTDAMAVVSQLCWQQKKTDHALVFGYKISIWHLE